MTDTVRFFNRAYATGSSRPKFGYDNDYVWEEIVYPISCDVLHIEVGGNWIGSGPIMRQLVEDLGGISTLPPAQA